MTLQVSPHLVTDQLVAGAKRVIDKGSKSFAFASLFLPKRTFWQVCLVYQWCRYCDDQIDALDSKSDKNEAFHNLQQLTTTALSHQELPAGVILPDAFEGLRLVWQQGALDSNAVFEMIEGFRKDLSVNLQVQTEAELDLYCHQVAGTVGLMLLPGLIGSEKNLSLARDTADSLGKAMQLTNIARDIAEDALNGRCYLPVEYLNAEGIDREAILNKAQLHAQFKVVKRILAQAEQYYKVGFSGLRWLPLRVALAVALAGLVYRRIGKKIEAAGVKALTQRVFVGKIEKLFLVPEAVYMALKSRFFTTEEKDSTSFVSDFIIYVSRIRLFSARDWLVYTVWIGMMFGLFASITAFLVFGKSSGVHFPDYVWSIAFGSFVFSVAIAIDTIGHRTIYLEELKKGEALIHHITIFSGVTSVLGLCLVYEHKDWVWVPTLVLVSLSIIYSLFDEALHWIRYLTKKSDRIEMWSHYFIMLGHVTMVAAWVRWAMGGYVGVAETLSAWSRF